MAMSAQAGVLEVLDVRSTNRARIFEFLNDSLETSVVLDCASFIHNLHIENKSNAFTYYLSIAECEKAYEYVNEIYSSQRRCIEYELNRVFFNDCEPNYKRSFMKLPHN
jgi:hypothetical protein